MGGGRPDAGRSGAGAAGGGLSGMTSASTWFKRYLLPGFVFQVAVIAGRYATGRALVEIFLPAGSSGGLMVMVVRMVGGSVVGVDSLGSARVVPSHDYPQHFQVSLGRGRVLIEL